MSSVGIDDIIGHLNALKQQEIQLKLKDEQIKKYEDLLLSYKSTRFDDCFLIYSYDEYQENIEIITKYFMEFTELAYDHHYLLIAKKESNRNVAIYLMSFDDDCQLESTLDAIDLLIDRKRKQQEEDDCIQMPMNREMRIMNKILVEKVEQYERKTKEQEDQLREYVKKTEDFEQKVGEQTKKIEECEHQLNQIAKEKEEQTRNQLEPIAENSSLNGFLNDKNFEMTKNSTVVLDGLGNRLFKREEGDIDGCEPPLKEINSIDKRRKEVIDYIEFVRNNWNNPLSGTDIQKKIHYWIYPNCAQFLYNPSKEEKTNSRRMFSNKFKLRNTIGTIHFLSIQYINCTFYLCFAISNYRIVYWDWGSSQQEAFTGLYNRLKQQPTWTQNTKFATEMEVNDEQSETFIHTSNKDVFVDNEKVITWIKNNFNLERQSYNYSGYGIILSCLYNFIINLYEPPFFE